MKRIFLFTILSLCFYLANANSYTFRQDIVWENLPLIHLSPSGNSTIEIWQFDGAVYDARHPALPLLTHRFPLDGNSKLRATVVQAQYAPLNKKPGADDVYLREDLDINSTVSIERFQFHGNLSLIPIRKTGAGTYEKLISVEIRIDITPSPAISFRGPDNVTESVLADGLIYKMAIPASGMYKLDYDFLKDELKVAGLDNVNPAFIRIYAQGGGMLPEANDLPRIDDLAEIPVEMVDGGDGSFDDNDYILLYAEGANKLYFDADTLQYNLPNNIYDSRNYYFLKIDNENGLRISDQGNLSATAYTTNTFDDILRLEDDKYNLLDINSTNATQGSGKRWFGDYFGDAAVSRVYNFDFPNLVTTEPIRLDAVFAASCSTTSTWNISAGTSNFSGGLGASYPDDGEARFAQDDAINSTFSASGDQVSLTVTYNKPGCDGWLDYVQLTARRNLNMSGNQLTFRDSRTLAYPTATFQLGNASNITIWDITNPVAPRHQLAGNSGASLSFGVSTDQLKHFVAFDRNSSLLQPEAVGAIDNQNYHGIESADFVIVYPEAFEMAAQKLANHRRLFSGMTVETVRIDRLYNEFSSGRQDVSAIRDFARMLLGRSSDFRYMLLMGDGSFDYQNRKSLDEPNHFIPPYETAQSFHPISAFPSDDYFALLSPGEGALELTGDLDIAVGRMTVRTPENAEAVVEKIISYDTDPATFGDWRNNITYVADDEDTNTHIKDADSISNDVAIKYKRLNINKLYLDAFQQESTSGGARVPAVETGINNDMFRGAVAMCYMGHGGFNGWSQERVLRIEHIKQWNNQPKMPVLVTATCSFSGYDKPNLISAGEHILDNAHGGAIAVYSTVRAVYASSNEVLTRAVFDNIFEKINNQPQTIGEILRKAKNTVGSSENKRKFTLLGDPSQTIALPQYNVATTEINGTPADAIPADTIRALQMVTVKGIVTDENGNKLTNFNGKVYPTVFDKSVEVTTLAQDPDSNPYDFNLQKNIIFKGAASVINGDFSFNFVVPKDILYNYGMGKISYYAFDGVNDAAGSFCNFIVGGTATDAIQDDQPPLVEVFINNENWAFGGISDENPILVARLSDDFGINVSGTSIGHDLSGIVDQSAQQSYVLNNFYEATLDDYTEGTVRYPLYNIPVGRHQIRVKAWDIANNPGEGYTEFVVADSELGALEHVLNYPNPFTDNTFFQFEYPLRQLLDVQVNIFTVSGALVKTIQSQLMYEGGYARIAWDGRDEYGDQLARGIYLYRIKIRTDGIDNQEIKSESDFEKLVILK